MTHAPASQSPPSFSVLTVAWMLAVGAVSGLLFLVLTAYAPELRGGEGGTHALSNAAVGYRGMVELLSAEGAPVFTSRSPRPERDHPDSLLVLTPDLASDPKVLTALLKAGPSLVILPKWAAAPDAGHPGWVIKLGPAPDTAADRLLNVLDPGDHLQRRTGVSTPVLTAAEAMVASPSKIAAGAIDSLQTIEGPDRHWISALVDQDGRAVLIKKADAEIYILSDPDFFNNQGLAQLQNAKGASVIIDALRQGRSVVFDLTLSGLSRSRTLLRLAFEPPFLSVTLCFLFAAAMMGVHAAVRFGPTARSDRPIALGKRALADNSAALVRLAKREHKMGPGYAALVRGLAARAVGAPRDLDIESTDAMLDRLGRARGVQSTFSELERAAREARDVSSLMAASRRLFQWRLEMTRERG